MNHNTIKWLTGAAVAITASIGIGLLAGASVHGKSSPARPAASTKSQVSTPNTMRAVTVRGMSRTTGRIVRRFGITTPITLAGGQVTAYPPSPNAVASVSQSAALAALAQQGQFPSVDASSPSPVPQSVQLAEMSNIPGSAVSDTPTLVWIISYTGITVQQAGGIGIGGAPMASRTTAQGLGTFAGIVDATTGKYLAAYAW